MCIRDSDGRLGDADVWVWSSTDGGDSFRRAVRVNDTAPGDGTDQYLPILGVAPSGRVDVAYYDRRSDPNNLENEVSLHSSTNGGSTFGSRVAVSDRPFDARVGPGTERDMADLGSRIGLVSADDDALVIWTDTRAGTLASAKQDLARGVVAFTSPSPLRRALPPLGALVALAGMAVALFRPRTGRVASAPGLGALRPGADSHARSGPKGGHGG